MRANKKGYSLIVLIITIIVVLLLALVSVTSLRTSRSKTEATNFIYDLKTIEESVRNFYTSKGTLPINSNQALDIYDVAETVKDKNQMLSQLSNEDDKLYYEVDLSQLQGISIKDKDRGYIVNNGSQNIYVTKPLEYQKEGESKAQQYYTLTGDLVNGRDLYFSVEENIEIVGNPINWASKADLRMILPERAIAQSNWNGWEFKFSIGPKTQEEMEDKNAKVVKYNYHDGMSFGERIDTTNIVQFEYGDMITIKTNGTYTFYIKEPDEGANKGKVTLKNVNVTRIDDIKPTYEFKENGTKFYAIDNETGVKEIKYKKLSEFKKNKEKAEESHETHYDARSDLDFFLIDGEGRDLVYELKYEIQQYLAERKTINDAIDSENVNHTRWINDNPKDDKTVYQEDIDRENARHKSVEDQLKQTLLELNDKYAYLADLDGGTDDSRLVIYIKDNAGNGIVVGVEDTQSLTTRVLADSYNIPLDGLE